MILCIPCMVSKIAQLQAFHYSFSYLYPIKNYSVNFLLDKVIRLDLFVYPLFTLIHLKHALLCALSILQYFSLNQYPNNLKNVYLRKILVAYFMRLKLHLWCSLISFNTCHLYEELYCWIKSRTSQRSPLQLTLPSPHVELFSYQSMEFKNSRRFSRSGWNRLNVVLSTPHIPIQWELWLNYS